MLLFGYLIILSDFGDAWQLSNNATLFDFKLVRRFHSFYFSHRFLEHRIIIITVFNIYFNDICFIYNCWQLRNLKICLINLNGSIVRSILWNIWISVRLRGYYWVWWFCRKSEWDWLDFSETLRFMSFDNRCLTIGWWITARLWFRFSDLLSVACKNLNFTLLYWLTICNTYF